MVGRDGREPTAYQAGICMSRIREERFLSRRAVVRAALRPPVRLGGLQTRLSFGITKSGQEPIVGSKLPLFASPSDLVCGPLHLMVGCSECSAGPALTEAPRRTFARLSLREDISGVFYRGGQKPASRSQSLRASPTMSCCEWGWRRFTFRSAEA